MVTVVERILVYDALTLKEKFVITSEERVVLIVVVKSLKGNEIKKELNFE